MTTNLLIIMSDEHQARAMGCAGHPFVQTPNLDALAARGTRFTDAYTPCPICVPARASFATGRYVHQTRLWDNAMPYAGQIPGWGHALQARGVPVESIGKLHYRDAADPAGFDAEHIPMMVAGGVGMVWASIRRENERVAMPARMLGERIGPGTSRYIDYDTAVTRRACDWLHEHARDDRPWCLYVGLVAPHFPLVVPQAFYDLYPTHSLPPAKLHPRDGHPRHPWDQKICEIDRSEEKFEDEAERLRAMEVSSLCRIRAGTVRSGGRSRGERESRRSARTCGGPGGNGAGIAPDRGPGDRRCAGLCGPGRDDRAPWRAGRGPEAGRSGRDAAARDGVTGAPWRVRAAKTRRWQKRE